MFEREPGFEHFAADGPEASNQNIESEEGQKEPLGTLEEVLEKNLGDLTPRLRKLFELVIQKNPRFKHVKFDVFEAKDASDQGGFYDSYMNDDGNVVPLIFISDADPSGISELREVAKHSIRMNADLLGIPPEAMTNELIHTFIVAHELGHANDLMVNYLAVEGNEGWDGADEMDMHRRAILDNLPAGDISMTEIRAGLLEEDSLSVILMKHPSIRKHPRFNEIKTVDDLSRIQEEEYRKSEPERYADEFAAKLLLEHAKELGFADILGQPKKQLAA